jgi:hypothetical protein
MDCDAIESDVVVRDFCPDGPYIHWNAFGLLLPRIRLVAMAFLYVYRAFGFNLVFESLLLYKPTFIAPNPAARTSIFQFGCVF